MMELEIFKNTAREFFCVVLVSVVLALVGNGLSPSGIPFLGMWDVSSGVVTADPERNRPLEGIEIRDISEARRLFEEGEALFVDARPYSVYEEGHIPGAVSFPRGEMEERIADFMEMGADGRPIVVYCSGRECEDSHAVAAFLQEVGVSGVRVFIDGFAGWEQGGYLID